MKSSLSIVSMKTLLIMFDGEILREKETNNNDFSCFKFQLLFFIETQFLSCYNRVMRQDV
jgi:hypothetical protein